MQTFDPRRYVVVAAPMRRVGRVAGRDVPQAADLLPATVEDYSNNEVIVRASAAEPAWLVLNDSYAPGWRAYVRPAGADESAEAGNG